jgi:hypothetical protein
MVFTSTSCQSLLLGKIREWAIVRHPEEMASVEIAESKDIRDLDAFLDSLTEEEIDELNADRGGDEQPMSFELFCQKENIKLQK